ncbi:MAG: DNA replication/repair protein RecF, partial [Luteibaculum sp.]
ISKLTLIQFKNHESAEFELSPGLNTFVGQNGSGKTNILDAIYCLCYTKSFLNPVDSQLIHHAHGFYMLQGMFHKQEDPIKVSLGLKKGQKKQLKQNQKTLDRLADHIGFAPAVLIAPSDRDLIHEGSEYRRKFFDSILSTYDSAYLQDLLQYQQAIKNRNATLKQMVERRSRDASYLEVWDSQVIALSEKLIPKREVLVKEFLPLFQSLYQEISKGNETADITWNAAISEEGLEMDLKRSVERDLKLGYTTKGLHKDDFDLSLDGQPIKKFGSQGQQKTFLLAMKLANYKLLQEKTGSTPLLLLDDIFDKLDHQRVKHLLKLIHDEEFGQIFLTHTQKEELEAILALEDLQAKIFSL